MKTIGELLKEGRAQAEGKKEASAMYSDKAEGPRGIRIPNSTQVPNEIFDEYMLHLELSELRVLLFLIRKTFGFNKLTGDHISLSQLEKGTGLHRETIVKAVTALEYAQLIAVERKKDKHGRNLTTFYRLRIEEISRKG